MKRIDLTGQRFGRLTVIRYDHSEEKHRGNIRKLGKKQRKTNSLQQKGRHCFYLPALGRSFHKHHGKNQSKKHRQNNRCKKGLCISCHQPERAMSEKKISPAKLFAKQPQGHPAKQHRPQNRSCKKAVPQPEDLFRPFHFFRPGGSVIRSLLPF